MDEGQQQSGEPHWVTLSTLEKKPEMDKLLEDCKIFNSFWQKASLKGASTPTITFI